MTEQERYVLFLVRRYSRLSVSLFGSLEDAAQELWLFYLSRPNPDGAWKANFCRCFGWLIGHQKERQSRQVVTTLELAEPGYEQEWPDMNREQALKAAKKYLPQRSFSILVRHYGFEGEPETLRDISKTIGISNARVSMLNIKSLEVLRKKLEHLQ